MTPLLEPTVRFALTAFLLCRQVRWTTPPRRHEIGGSVSRPGPVDSHYCRHRFVACISYTASQPSVMLRPRPRYVPLLEAILHLERDTRFELVSEAWKATAHPLYQSRMLFATHNLSYSSPYVRGSSWSGHSELNRDSKIPNLSGSHTPPTLIVIWHPRLSSQQVIPWVKARYLGFFDFGGMKLLRGDRWVTLPLANRVTTCALTFWVRPHLNSLRLSNLVGPQRVEL